MELKKAYLGMIKSFPGGWDAMSAAMGMSRTALENRIYERKGQAMLVEQSLQMQEFSGVPLFAQAVAHVSRGVFLSLPEVDDIGRDELLAKFNQLYAKLGELSAKFNTATADGEIDKREKADLKNASQEIHQILAELVALTFMVYCPQEEEQQAD